MAQFLDLGFQVGDGLLEVEVVGIHGAGAIRRMAARADSLAHGPGPYRGVRMGMLHALSGRTHGMASMRAWGMVVALLLASPCAAACEAPPGITTTAVAPGVLRVIPPGQHPDPMPSWAVLPAQPGDDAPRLRAYIADPSCRIAVDDGDVRLFAWSEALAGGSEGRRRLRLSLQPQDHVYGLGDKA
ncbi:MAG TPA: hypothetical protein VNS59_02855, partial [Lysobacter sp.]|nr:hypothetical protein [Lysobacter sp.]